MQGISSFKLRNESKLDWRGWITLMWVIGWGWAYGVMVFQARAPHVLAWLRELRR